MANNRDTDAKPKRNGEHDKDKRDSGQSFLSSNTVPENYYDDFFHSPGISDGDAAWSPLEKPMVGRLDGPFSSGPEKSSPGNKARHSSRLNSPFNPDRWEESLVEPPASGRLSSPFDERVEWPFPPTDSSSPYDNQKRTGSKKGKYRPESSTSLNSQITREINNWGGYEPVSTYQSSFHPRYDEGWEGSTGTRLTKKTFPGSDMNLPPRLQPLPRIKLPPEEQKSRRYLSKREPPPALTLTNSSRNFSGSEYGYGAAGPDMMSTLSEKPRRPPPEKNRWNFRRGTSKGSGKSTYDNLPLRQLGQQQQQQIHARDHSVSPVSPGSHGPRGSPVSPVSPLSSTDDHYRDLTQKSEISPISLSQGHGNPDYSEVQVLQPTKLQPELIFRGSTTDDAESDGCYTEADSTLWKKLDLLGGPTQQQFTGRFEFELEIPVVTATESDSECDDSTISDKKRGKRRARVRTKTTDITTIEECLSIKKFRIGAVVNKLNPEPCCLKCTMPSYCLRMDNNPAKPTSDKPNESDEAMCRVRYYGIVTNLSLPPSMAKCELVANFEVEYSRQQSFEVTLKNWNVDVAWIQSVHKQRLLSLVLPKS